MPAMPHNVMAIATLVNDDDDDDDGHVMQRMITGFPFTGLAVIYHCLLSLQCLHV